MNRTLTRAVRRSRTNSEFFTKKHSDSFAQADYKIKVKPNKLICKVRLPASVRLNWSRLQRSILEAEWVRALESVLLKHVGEL